MKKGINNRTIVEVIVVIALIILLFTIIVLLFSVFNKFPSYEFRELTFTKCKNNCASLGYSSGECLLSSEKKEFSMGIGSCFVKGSEKCSMKNNCGCYCR